MDSFSHKTKTKNNSILFEAKSVQSSNLRTLFEVLKEILIEFNLIITDKYIKSTVLDNSQKALIHLKLNASSFDYYYCDPKYTANNPLIIGIDAIEIFNVMKTIKQEDVIGFVIDEKNPEKFIIKKENSNINSKTTYKLSLRSLDFKKIIIPETNFTCEHLLPSLEFQKICKDFKQLKAEVIEIKSINDAIIFSANTHMCQSELVIKTPLTLNDNTIYQGVYLLVYLLRFTKATSLSKNVKILIKNDYPLILSYDIGQLGEIQFCINGEKNEPKQSIESFYENDNEIIF